MIAKKHMMFFLSIFFLLGIYTPIKPINVMNIVRWAKQKIAGHPITRGIAMTGVDAVESVSVAPVVHTKREVTKREVECVNNLPTAFDLIKDDPAYAGAPSLIDQTIIVNGKAIMPGTSAPITIEDGKGVITIKCYKGFAKVIYAMQQGALRSILMQLLKRMDPWLQWQFTVPFTVPDDVDVIGLSDIVLAAYQKSLDQNAINHKLKYILIVDLSLNDPIKL